MRICKHIRTLLCLFLVSFLGSGTVAEVGVVTKQGTDIVVAGPYLMSIIEDSEPVGMWARHAQTSSTRVVLNEAGAVNGDGRPAVDLGSGVPIVTWGKNNGTGFDIVESHFENGAWTTPAIIAAAVTVSIDPEPSIVVDEQTGAVHIVYVVGDAAPQVMHREAPADLSSWTPPVLVSELGADALRPSAVRHQGTLIVAYEFHTSGVGYAPRQITVAISDGIGGFTHETIDTTHCAEPNRPQLHTAGNSMWIDWIDGAGDMAWSTWDDVTGWGSAQIELFSDVEDRDYHVRGRVERLATQ